MGNRSDTGKVWGVLNVWQNYSDQKVQGERIRLWSLFTRRTTQKSFRMV